MGHHTFTQQPDTVNARQERKARMSKTHFSFWNNKEDKGMSNARTLYTSEIDAQAKKGGPAADGRAVKSQLKRSNITIGSDLN